MPVASGHPPLRPTLVQTLGAWFPLMDVSGPHTLCWAQLRTRRGSDDWHLLVLASDVTSTPTVMS